MEIEEAFTAQAIEAAGTNVTETEEERLAVLVDEYIRVNELVITRDEDLVNLCVLMFVAGRTDQAGRIRIPIQMSPGLANQFMEFLADME